MIGGARGEASEKLRREICEKQTRTTKEESLKMDNEWMDCVGVMERD